MVIFHQIIEHFSGRPQIFHVFFFPPPKDNLTKKAYKGEIFKRIGKVASDGFEWHNVTDVAYSEHRKAGSPPMLRVRYLDHKGLEIGHGEYIQFERTGYPRTLAEGWWKARNREVECPKTVAEALMLVPSFPKPKKITLTSGNFQNPAMFKWDDE